MSCDQVIEVICQAPSNVSFLVRYPSTVRDSFCWKAYLNWTCSSTDLYRQFSANREIEIEEELAVDYILKAIFPTNDSFCPITSHVPVTCFVIGNSFASQKHVFCAFSDINSCGPKEHFFIKTRIFPVTLRILCNIHQFWEILSSSMNLNGKCKVISSMKSSVCV